MRDGWVQTTLGDVAEVVGGGTPSTSVPEYWDGDIVWLTPTEVTSQDGKIVTDSTRKITSAGLRGSGAQLLPKGSVVLTSRASVGYVAIAGTELCTNQGFQSLVPRESVLAEFLLFWVQRNRSEFESRSAGSTFKEISKSNVKSIKLSVPPMPEQKRIVDLASSVDSYIEALRQQLEGAKISRNAVLHELLNAGGDGWVETKLGQYIQINTGKRDVNASSEFGAYPFFTCSRETYRIDEAAFDGESVLVAGNGDLNVKYYDGKFNAYQRTYVLKSVDKTVLDNRFLYIYMQTYVDYLRSETRGTVIQYLKKDQFTDAKIKLPPLPEQERIVDLISTVDSFIDSLEGQINSSTSLRSGLLSDLLSGNHEIPSSYDQLIGAA